MVECCPSAIQATQSRENLQDVILISQHKVPESGKKVKGFVVAGQTGAQPTSEACLPSSVPVVRANGPIVQGTVTGDPLLSIPEVNSKQQFLIRSTG